MIDEGKMEATPIVLTAKAVEMVKHLRTKEGRPDTHALRV